MINNTSTTQFEQLEIRMSECNDFFNKNHQDSNFNELEGMLKGIKKLVARNTLVNAFAFIEKVVENGTKAYDGMNKQFNVFSVQITPNDEILLVAREVLGIDSVDKKYVLDSDPTLINLKDITRVF